MRILVISDTHNKIDHVIEILERDHKFDRIFHLGDLVCDAKEIESMYPIPIDYVSGNCDWNDVVTSSDKVIIVEGKRILLTHGHKYKVKQSNRMLRRLAEKGGYDAVLYGHSHVVSVKYIKNYVILNPGSISLPRDGAPSFAIMTISKQGEIVINIKRIT